MELKESAFAEIPSLKEVAIRGNYAIIGHYVFKMILELQVLIFHMVHPLEKGIRMILMHLQGQRDLNRLK